MGLFDLLGASSRKMYSRDFRKQLRKISVLSSKEQGYVERAFQNDLKGGLSKFEIKERCRKLRHKTGDPLEPSEVEKIKKELLKYFD